MVLFNEAEATMLLDLYLHYRSNPQNLTSGGVLLKMHARDELTRAMNRYFHREAPWTESQVTVKFKNLRSEYIELKWLGEQPGFQPDGKGLTDEWWSEIKARRPKVHAFKGKLPWQFFKKMAVIVGDLPATSNVTDSRSMQRISQLLNEMAADAVHNTGGGIGNNNSHMRANGHDNGDGSASSNGAAHGNGGVTVDLTASRQFLQQQQLLLQNKRQREANNSSGGKRPRKRMAELTEQERERQQALVKSVEHGSKAAADMAKGFNDLVAVYTQQAAKSLQVDVAAAAGGEDSLEAQEQRQILMSLAASLEKSSQATAEMAKGYRDLVTFFIQESEDSSAVVL